MSSSDVGSIRSRIQAALYRNIEAKNKILEALDAEQCAASEEDLDDASDAFVLLDPVSTHISSNPTQGVDVVSASCTSTGIQSADGGNNGSNQHRALSPRVDKRMEWGATPSSTESKAGLSSGGGSMGRYRARCLSRYDCKQCKSWIAPLQHKAIGNNRCIAISLKPLNHDEKGYLHGRWGSCASTDCLCVVDVATARPSHLNLWKCCRAMLVAGCVFKAPNKCS